MFGLGLALGSTVWNTFTGRAKAASAAPLDPTLESAALVVKRPDGKLKVEGPHEGSVWSGTAWGIVFGTLIGLIFLVPLFGLITGGIFGALFGAMDKSGVDEEFRTRAREYEENPELVRGIIDEGCEKAREIARQTLEDVRDAMGLSYR